MLDLKTVIPLGIAFYVGYTIFRGPKKGNGSAVGSAPKLQVSTRLLRRGDRGSDVRSLQLALNYLGYIVGPIDGIFGEQTEQALRAFQRDANITPDGIAGPETYNAIDTRLRVEGGHFLYLGV